MANNFKPRRDLSRYNQAAAIKIETNFPDRIQISTRLSQHH